MTMGENIKTQRKRTGLTQQELADKLGLQKPAIAKYENGRVQNIKRSTLEKMADILNCSPAFLMGFEENILVERESASSSDEQYKRYARYLDLFQQLNNDNQERLNKYAETLLSLQQQETDFLS